MDYKILIYPSNEKEMMSVKDEAKAKVVKIVKQTKLKEVYKAQFGAAVKKFNDTALAGKMIDDYYKSILESNIPEVYCISIIVRFDLASKAEAQIVDKSFMDYKKELEKLKNIAISSVYFLNQDEFKEIQVYFVPVSSGYSMGLSVKNDLIDIMRKEFDIKDNINILKAMPLATQYFEKLWAQASDSSIITEEELEKRARDYQPEDPLMIHSIEVGQLKENLNKLQLLHSANQILVDQVEAEKKRIQGDLDWIAMTEPKICQAEAERIAEEKRRIEEELRRKEEEKLAAIRDQEARKAAEEARISEAARLTEQAKRNIALRSMLSREIGLEEESDSRMIVDKEMFNNLLTAHKEWMSEFKITPSTDLNKIDPAIVADNRRLNLSGVEIEDVSFEVPQTLIGASFKDVKLIKCNLRFTLIGCNINKLTLDQTIISDSKIVKSALRGVVCEQGTITNVSVESSAIVNSNFSYSEINNLMSAPAVSYVETFFEKTKFLNCDMKRNGFVRCSFESATFNTCDMRSSTFQRCNLENINRVNSLFNSAGIN